MFVTFGDGVKVWQNVTLGDRLKILNSENFNLSPLKNLIIFFKYVIILLVVHYSSYTSYYEGGAKNPLKGTSMKFLVYARNASFVCLQGVKILGNYVMAYV